MVQPVVTDEPNTVTVEEDTNTVTVQGGVVGAPRGAQYVVVALDATLTNERALTAGEGIALVDGGANSTVTLDLDIDGLTEEATVDGAADFFVMFDTSAGVHRKVLGNNLPGGGGGSAVILDLGDDGANESSDLAEIATVNDTNSIFTEPSADKLLIDMSQNWPSADDASQLGGVAAASYLRSDASDTYSGTTLTVTGTIDASGGGLVFPTALTPAPTVEGSAVWDTDDDVLRVGDGVGTVVLEPLGNLVRADIDALGTGSVVYTTETQTLTGKTVDLANNTVTGTAAEFNAAVSDDTFAFTSDTLAVFAATTSAQLAGVISDETGSGLLVFGTSPTVGGTVTFTNAGAGADPTISSNDAGQVLTVTGTLDATALTEGGNAVPNATDDLSFFSATTSAQLAGVISDETGSGALVFGSSPSIASANLTGTITGSPTLSGTWTWSGNVVLPTATAPGQTVEGSVVWDSDDDKLTVGDGVGRQIMVNETRTLTGGDGINALGDLSADRTVSVDIVASDGLQFVTGELTVDEANIDHDALLNFVANEHVDHSSVTLTAGTGLTGGGDITASRSFNVDESSSLTWTGTIDFSGGSFIFPTATAPTPTTEGQAVWDSDDDVLRIGDGVGTVTLDPSSGAPTNAEYVVMSLNGSLSDERVLTAGTNLTLTDGGANGNATLDVNGDDALTWTGLQTFENQADAASVQTVVLSGNRATPANNDEAFLTLQLSDGGGTQTEYARLTWVATDVTDATEDGQVRVHAVTAGSLGEVFRVDDAGISLDDGTTTISASELNLLDGKTNLVDATGTPADNQVAVWTDADTVEGDANLTWDGASLLVGSTVLDVDTSNTRVHLGVPSADPGSGAMSAAQLVFWLDEVNDQIEARALESDGATNITVTLGTGGGGSPGGSDTHVQFNDGGSFGGSANLTWDDNTLFVENEADVASAQVLTLSGNRATVADNDEGFVALQLSDGGGTQTEFARLTWVATDVTDTTEDGQLRFSAMVAGTLSEVFRVDDAGVSLDDGTTTVSSAELNLLDGMTAKTGADTSFATGTAGTSGNLAEWNADGDLVDSGNATSDFGPVGASYVVIALDGTLTSERVLTAGTNLSLTDGGAGGNATLDVDDAFVLNTGDTITGALVVDTAAGTNTSIDETGIDRSSTGVETFNVQNSGAGSLTLQEDGTDVAVVTDTLDVFAATTSAELASVISDETGSGALVFGTNPTVDFSGGTFTFPTATAPTPTTEGQAVWDSDDDVLRIGDGVGTVTLDPSAGAPTNAEYVVMSLNGSLSDERVLTAGTNLTLTDGGANGNATLDVDDAFVLNTGDTITGALTFDTAAGTNAAVDEAGIDRSSGSAETFNVQNSGAGAMTLQQDGTAVVVETRALTAGAGLTGGGDLSADRTFDVGAGTGITVNANDVAVDTSSTFSWSSSHTFNDVTQFNASIKLSDLDQVSFGVGANYIFVYDSADNRFELRGGDIDGAGGNGDIFRVDDAQQGITFLGSVTVANSTLSLDNGGTVIAAAELNLLDGMTAKTGLDTVFVTGTAGTAGNLAEWNSDGDAVDAGLSIADVTTRSLTPGGATLPDTAFPELIKVSGGTGDFEWYELRYDDSTDENAYWTFHAPSATDATITIFWKAAATTGDVVWSVGHRSVTAGDAWDAADTDVTVTDTVEGTAEDTGIASTTLTAPFGAGEQVQLRVGRDADAAGDTMSGDAKILGIKVTFA